MSMNPETKQKKSTFFARLTNKKERRIKPLLLECRCRGKLFFSIHTEKMSFPFKIGKAADNNLVLPPNDRTSQDHEAFLDNVKGKLVLKAVENRFFYVHGATKESYVLPQEDRVVIGDCELFVTPAEKLSETSQTHRLEFLNGPRKGKIYSIEKERLLIGSSEKCDLQFESDVVSEFHAEIKIGQTGEAWIKDLESVNGTFVNGRRLSSQARVMMDMDKISVACYDFRF